MDLLSTTRHPRIATVVRKLREKSRLADTRFADDRDDLALSAPSYLQRLIELPKFQFASNELLRPRAIAACSRERTALAPMSSKTSSGAFKPLINCAPVGFTST